MNELSTRYYEFGPFRLDTVKRILLRDMQPVALTPKAYETLLALVQNSGKVLEREKLMGILWPDSFVEEANLSVNISALRKALGESAGQHKYIVTIPGRGYNFVAPVREVQTGAAEPEAPEPVTPPPAPQEPLYVYEAGQTSEQKLITASNAEAVQTEQAKQPVSAWETFNHRAKRLWPWLVGTLALFSSVAIFQYFRSQPPQPLSITPFTSFANNETEPAFSPAGNQIAFVWDGDMGNNNDIYVKPIGAGPSLRLTTFPGHDVSPAWSPDGNRIAFIRVLEGDRGIYTVSALGGSEQKLSQLTTGILHLGLSWSPDGKALAFADRDSDRNPHSIYLLSIDSLERQKLTAPVEDFGDTRPAFSPDGKTLAFIRQTTYGTDIYLQPITGGEPRRLTADNRRVEGFTWTADGAAIVFSSNRDGQHRLWWVAVSGGGPERVETGAGNAFSPAISLKGNRLAYMQDYVDANIWRVATQVAAGQPNLPVKLIGSSREEGNPQFSADGKRIVYESDQSGAEEIWVCGSDGMNASQIPGFGNPYPGNPHFSADGKQIAYDARPEGHRDIFVVDAQGGRPRRLTTDTSSEVAPGWSRDGRWIYFASDRDGRWNLWKIPAAGGETVQVTKNGGYTSAESPDGKLLHYARFDGPGIWSVPVEGGEETLVVDSLATGDWGRWGVTDQGLYFFRRNEPAAPTIELYSFATRRLTRLAELDKNFRYRSGFAVSPDSRWVLFTRVDYRSKDILLVENFR